MDGVQTSQCLSKSNFLKGKQENKNGDGDHAGSIYHCAWLAYRNYYKFLVPHALVVT